jgi:hypothetical protein
MPRQRIGAMTRVLVPVRLSDASWEEFRTLAKATGQTQGGVIRRLIVAWVRNRRAKEEAKEPKAGAA